MTIFSGVKKKIRKICFPSMGVLEQKLIELEANVNALTCMLNERNALILAQRKDIAKNAEMLEKINDLIVQQDCSWMSKLEEYAAENRAEKKFIKDEFIFEYKKLESKLNNLLPQEYLNTIKSGWWYYGSNDSLLALVERNMHSPYCWKTYDTDYWLIAMSIFIKLGKDDVAYEMAELYKTYHGFTRVDNYLVVADFFCKNYKTDTRIKMAQDVYIALEKNKKNNVIEKHLKGKSIAIVGNGPANIGKEKGGEIDSHDIVIRFNNYQVEGFEVDYGSKTNIWVRGSGADDIVDRTNIDDYDLVIWEGDYEHFAIYYDNLDILHRYILQNPFKCCNFDFETHFTLRESSKITFPSTGLLTIWKVIQTVGRDNVNIYGFSALEDNADFINSHYFKDRKIDDSIERTGVHQMDKESSFLNKMLNIKK